MDQGAVSVNIYFEVSDSFLERFGGRKYLAWRGLKKGTFMKHFSYNLLSLSDRAWTEDEDGVRYLKNRYEDISTAVVDMGEFMLVKLRSHYYGR